MRRRALVTAAALLLALGAGVTAFVLVRGPAGSDVLAASYPSPVTLEACARVAAPKGDDDATGTPAQPYRTVARLLEGLSAGETGCLRDGVFAEDVDVQSGGAPGSPIVLAAAPGETATLRGRLVIADGANDIVVTGLRLDGSNEDALPSPTVNGDRVLFFRNEVTNENTSICFVLGSVSGFGTAVDVVLSENRIHNCGRLPATNRDHGVYLESSRNARVVDNVIYANADRGIQLYPDAQDTTIERNVIVGNGQGIIFSGEDGLASSGNHVADNLIGDSTLRWNVESYWPNDDTVGSDNLLEDNCVWNGREGEIAAQVGFTARRNRIAEPLFVDEESGDFRQRPESPCAGVGPRPDSAALTPR